MLLIKSCVFFEIFKSLTDRFDGSFIGQRCGIFLEFVRHGVVIIVICNGLMGIVDNKRRVEILSNHGKSMSIRSASRY